MDLAGYVCIYVRALYAYMCMCVWGSMQNVIKAEEVMNLGGSGRDMEVVGVEKDRVEMVYRIFKK